MKESARPRKAYENGAWGLSIKTKERLAPQTGRGMSFGVVITLKEMYGENRIDESYALLKSILAAFGHHVQRLSFLMLFYFTCQIFLYFQAISYFIQKIESVQ